MEFCHHSCGNEAMHRSGEFLNKGPELQEDMRAEVESLQLELETTVSLYKRACEELVHAQKQVRV